MGFYQQGQKSKNSLERWVGSSACLVLSENTSFLLKYFRANFNFLYLKKTPLGLKKTLVLKKHYKLLFNIKVQLNNSYNFIKAVFLFQDAARPP